MRLFTSVRHPTGPVAHYGVRRENFRAVLRALWHRSLSALPFDLALTIARQLLEHQGFGAGAEVATSGELSVFELVASTQEPTLFDVGAHVGDYAAAFLDRFPGGRVLAFEPSAEHFRRLSRRLGGQPKAVALNVALGEAPADATLYKDAAVSGLASLTRRRLDHFGIALDIEERVRVSTVDAMRREADIDFIDLLKIDVEGHELAVLRGASGAFADRAVGVVQFEFGGSNLDTRTSLQDFFYFLEGHGYGLNIVKPAGHLHPLPRYDELYEQYRTTNYVATAARQPAAARRMNG